MKKAAIFCGVFLLLTSCAFAFQMQSGYFVGTGLARSITGVGFQPDLVIINSDTATGRSVWRSSAMSGDSTAYFENAVVNETGLVRSLDSDGFSLGTNANVNARNVRYTWSAYKGTGGGDFYVGSYTGNGIDLRNITAPGFDPALVWIKRDGASVGVWYTSAMPADSTQYFSATAPAADRVQSMIAGGFQIGANAEVNQSGDTYYYIAFKATVEASCGLSVGTYTGDGVFARSITGVGFTPDRVMIKRNAASNAVLRNGNHYGDETANFTLAANSTNCVRALENDGFQLGTDARVNANASAYYYAAFHGSTTEAPTGGFRMTAGSYTGNGTSQPISGLGFHPDLVIIKGDSTQLAVFTTSLMAPNTTAYLGSATASLADGIVSLDGDGFSLGSNATVNTALANYRYYAFAGAPCANFNIGAYTGLGVTSDNRSVTGLGFAPDLVAVKRDGASFGVFKTSAIAGDNTAYFSATADTADRVQTLEADGFQVGANAEVNTAAATNFFFAFKNTAGQFSVEAYTGDGLDNRSVPGLGFRAGYVWTKRPEVTSAAVQRGYNLSGDLSQYFAATANGSGLVKSLGADGFTLGTNAAVNGSGVAYRFAAWKANSTKLVYTQQPTAAVAGTSISPAITIAVRDNDGNTDTADNVTQVMLRFKNNPGGSVLSGTTIETAVAGTATFSNISINKAAAGYTLEAVSTNLAPATSEPFTISAAAASTLGFTVQPSQVKSRAVISPTVEVAVQDAYGNLVSAGSTFVHLSLKSGTGPLAGTVSRETVSGIAHFNDLTIEATGSNYSLHATCDSYALATSETFSVIPADASHLHLLTPEVANAQAGATLSLLTVEVTDGINVIGGDNSTQVTIAIRNNPGGGTLSGTTTKTVASGVATFSNLSINKTGTGYTLEVSAGVLVPATTESFAITPAAAHHLAYSVQPTDEAAGATMAPAVKVRVLDQYDNLVTTATNNVTIGISNNAGGGTLSGTLTKAAVTGEANFGNLSINKIGTGYTLINSSSGLIGYDSDPFNVTLAPSNTLAVYVQPANTVAGATITPPIQIAVQDPYGNTNTGDNSTEVTIAIGANPGGGALSGTATQTAVAGIVTFADLSINKSGAGYTLAASAPLKTGATSGSFNITPAAAGQLAFSVQPSQTAAGVSIAPAVKVDVQDLFGNTITSDNSTLITMEIASNPGSGTLSGTTAQTAAAGIATFTNLSVNKIGAGYTLSAEAAGLANTISAAFNVVPGVGTNLAYLVQPATAEAWTGITPEVVVAVRDADNNLVTTDNATVIRLALQNNPGSGALLGTAVKTVAGGLATFEGISVNKPGAGYTIAATAAALTAATSEGFDITQTASQLAFLVQPGNAPAGSAIAPPVTVVVRDRFGNPLLADNTTSLSLLIGTNPGGGILSGTTTKTAAGGIATFETISIDKVGTGYTLSAEAAGLAGADSAPFNVTSALASRLAFLVQPVTTRAGVIISPEVKVALLDQFGNIVTVDNTTEVTVAIRDNPGSGSLFGTKTRTAAGGVASFTDLRINKKGDGYTLEAAALSLVPATSEPFNITGEAPAPLVLSLSPSRDAANVPAVAAVRISFDQPMDQAAVAAAFSLKAIMDNNGTSLEAIGVSGTATWDAAVQLFSFIPSALNKGYQYRAELAATAQSADQVKIASAESWLFTVIYDHSKENTTYSTDRRASVRTGSGTLPTDGYILINRDPQNAPTVVDPAAIAAAIAKVLALGDPHHYPLQATITEFNLFDASGTRVATTFAEVAILTLYYTAEANEKNLVLYRLDEAHGLWVKVPGSTVNTVDNYVSAPVRSFSVYAIMAVPALSVSGVYAFPNPFQPSAGHATVTFTNLASQCTIKIYTLTGDLVKTINESSGTGQNAWDVKNESGELLASGTYFYFIKSSGDTKSGKLVVIR